MNITNSSEFMNNFLSLYLRGGLGSMSKKDTDSLIVWLIAKDGSYNSVVSGELDSYRLSLALKVPHKRIQELLFNARLKFEVLHGDKDVLSEIAKSLLLSRFQKVNDAEIKITITDDFTRQALEHEIRSRKGMFERFLNRENISIDIETLSQIMSNLCGDDQWEHIEKNFAKTISTTDKDSFFIKLLQNCTNGFTEEASKEIGKGVGKVVAATLTGGISEILSYLKKGE
jgi:hypothetical protein